MASEISAARLVRPTSMRFPFKGTRRLDCDLMIGGGPGRLHQIKHRQRRDHESTVQGFSQHACGINRHGACGCASGSRHPER
ncbi:hypothetical protein AALO_G00086300 [Alosa alosa]|uniref:Uncharacterized protein n=1 Tax=Alosa alosa TaxID=278164 RepID=A0AAV6GYL7_9TELE|nr:hypothetical protein AALO_G00086300 [Alosa alosa]